MWLTEMANSVGYPPRSMLYFNDFGGPGGHARKERFQYVIAPGSQDVSRYVPLELLAIAALIEAHREEFVAHIEATEQRREWLARKAAMEQKPKQPRPRPL